MNDPATRRTPTEAAGRPGPAPIRYALAQVVLALTLASAADASFAQAAPDARVERAMQALRQTRAALQQVQQQQQVLAAERDREVAARQAAQAELAAVRLQLRAQSEQLQAFKRSAQAAEEAQRLATQEAESRERGASQAAARREAELQAALAEASRVGQSRQQANAALSALLAQRAHDLALARYRIDQVHGLGLSAIQAYADKGRTEQALQREPLLGWSAVRIEDRAERLRQQLDAARVAQPRSAAPEATGQGPANGTPGTGGGASSDQAGADRASTSGQGG